MRILMVSSMLPFRNTRFGGSKRLFHLAEEIGKHAELSIISVDACLEMAEFRENPPEFERILSIDADLTKNYWNRHVGFSIDLSQDFQRHRDSIDAFLGEADFDVLVLAYPLALSFLGAGWERRCAKVAYLEDDLALETYRTWYSRASNPFRKVWKFWRHFQLLRYYRRKLDAVSTLIAISSQEKDILSVYFPDKRIVIVKHGLPAMDYPLQPPPPRRQVLGFIGNYRHPPNLTALAWLLGEIFPHLRNALPELELRVAGRFIPKELRSRHAADSAISFAEDVPNLADFYGSIGIFINPIVSGRGMRTKLIEAAAFGRPIISTALGAEGLEDMQLGVSEDKEAILANLRKMCDGENYSAIVRHNREVFESRYTSERVGGSLLAALD